MKIEKQSVDMQKFHKTKSISLLLNFSTNNDKIPIYMVIGFLQIKFAKNSRSPDFDLLSKHSLALRMNHKLASPSHGHFENILYHQS